MQAASDNSRLSQLALSALTGLFLAFGAAPATAASDSMQRMPDMDHSQMDMNSAPPARKPDKTQAETAVMDHGDMHMQGGKAPADARDPHADSGGFTLDAGPYALPGPRLLKMGDEHTFMGLKFDRLERTHSADVDSTRYDLQAWRGRDYDQLVLKAEGDIVHGKLEDANTQLLWGHAIATYWDAQLGLRYDSGDGPNRTWLAFGVQGTAPYWFEVDATGYVGENGRTALGLEVEYELLLTQKIILQPRIEAEVFGKRDRARATGSGLSELSAGVRLRYEIRREFAPYIGVERVNTFGGTRNYLQDAGKDASETLWVAGVRFWY